MGRKTTKQLEEEQNSLRSQIRIIEDEIEERQEKEGRPAADLEGILPLLDEKLK